MARTPEEGLSSTEKLHFVLANELLWRLGETAPRREDGTPGAPRHYPEWVWILFDTCVSLNLSARKAAAELRGHWPTVVAASKARYPGQPDMWAPAAAPKRHHWQYAKKRLRQPGVLRPLIEEFERGSARQAVEMGICDPDGPGSISHPHPRRALTADGKVITPLYRAKPNTAIVDKDTGEILGYKKADSTAKNHVEGGGATAWGNKVVMVTGRTDDWHGRMILSFDHVATTSGEAQVAISCVERIAPHLPGAQALAYDGAIRGVHARQLLHKIGIIPVSPPTAARAETPDSPREEKRAFIETQTVGDWSISLYGRGGQIGIVDYDADGEPSFVALKRTRIKRANNADRTYRWYGQYQLPGHLGGGKIWVRADTTDADDQRKVNRSENFRLIPPGDPDYAVLYPGRSDIEANNRQLEDTLWINRAHSEGAQAQLLDLLGYALLYNSIAVGLARAKAPPNARAAAA